jgi:IclR helix-turn-helix domain
MQRRRPHSKRGSVKNGTTFCYMVRSSSGQPVPPVVDGRPRYPLASVDNALRLLLCLSRGKAIRVTDAASELKVARSTAHRLLAMFEFRGLVRQDPSSRTYVPGQALVEAARAIIEEKSCARPTGNNVA